MRKTFLTFLATLLLALPALALGKFGDWTCSVALSGYVSDETGKAPNAFLWIPDGCERVNFAVLAQQNMTEEALLRSPLFRSKMAEQGGALIWVAPWFSQNWSPTTGCQQTFEEMMVGLAGQSGHAELKSVPIVPFGHSAQATFPWNFAAWNPDRTLCIISFHGDAPRTNLCGYGTANVEWGRQRNIDGIPGLMIEGEYEWWEARVRPALAFRMMYPASCISFLCDTGRGHFDCGDETINYIAKFIEKAVKARLNNDGTLRKVNPRDGWLACRYNADLPANDGDGAGKDIFIINQRPQPAPWAAYRGDPHDAFWYFDREMAEMTEARYAATHGKRQQWVGIIYNGQLIPYNPKTQGGMKLHYDSDDITFTLRPVLVDETRTKIVNRTRYALGSSKKSANCKLEYICGAVEQLNDTTFRLRPNDAGWDNQRRAFTVWLCAVAEPTTTHKGAVQPLCITFDKKIIEKIK